jgi:hypothetical protein
MGREIKSSPVGCAYNTRLQKGGALLDDMRLLVRHWQNKGADGQRDTVVAENLLGKHTRTRAADTLRYAYLPRFVNGQPPQAWKLVRALEDRNLSVEILRPVYYWITVRSERLLYDFIRTESLASASVIHSVSPRMRSAAGSPRSLQHAASLGRQQSPQG